MTNGNSPITGTSANVVGAGATGDVEKTIPLVKECFENFQVILTVKKSCSYILTCLDTHQGPLSTCICTIELHIIGHKCTHVHD